MLRALFMPDCAKPSLQGCATNRHAALAGIDVHLPALLLGPHKYCEPSQFGAIALTKVSKGNARILNSTTGDSLVQTTRISNQQYLVALLVFIISYSVFEVPSNYMLHRLRPSRWYVFQLAVRIYH